jgi:hypothetical protein
VGTGDTTRACARAFRHVAEWEATATNVIDSCTPKTFQKRPSTRLCGDRFAVIGGQCQGEVNSCHHACTYAQRNAHKQVKNICTAHGVVRRCIQKRQDILTASVAKTMRQHTCNDRRARARKYVVGTGCEQRDAHTFSFVRRTWRDENRLQTEVSCSMFTSILRILKTLRALGRLWPDAPVHITRRRGVRGVVISLTDKMMRMTVSALMRNCLIASFMAANLPQTGRPPAHVSVRGERRRVNVTQPKAALLRGECGWGGMRCCPWPEAEGCLVLWGRPSRMKEDDVMIVQVWQGA